MLQRFRFQHYLFACSRLFLPLGGQSDISTTHFEIMDLGGRKIEWIIKFRDLFKKHLNLMGWKSLITPNKGRDSSKTHFILKVILKMEPWFVVSIKLERNHLNKNLIPNSCPDQPFWYLPPLIYCHCIQTLASHFPEITKTKWKKFLSLWALLWSLIIMSFEWLSPWRTENSNIIFFCLF